jgi:ABC-type molybdate transport system substrate-binding protein
VNSEIWIPTILVQKSYGAKMQSIATGLVLLVLGCGVAVSMSSPYYGAGAGADDAVAVEISVAAPAGLNAAMTDVARAFESRTGNHVHLTFVDADTLYS